MEAHQGRINVFSEPEKGSTFRVTFLIKIITTTDLTITIIGQG